MYCVRLVVALFIILPWASKTVSANGADYAKRLHNRAIQAARAEKYDEALKAYEEYVKITPELGGAFHGVRRSALNSWWELTKKYPPAKASLAKFLRESTKAVTTDEKHANWHFQAVTSINRHMDKRGDTVKLFKTLSTKNHPQTDRLYLIAEEDLIDAKEFALCGKHINPRKRVPELLEMYVIGMNLAQEEGNRRTIDMIRDGGESLSLDIANMVAILIKNGRQQEASEITAAVDPLYRVFANFSDTPGKQLQAALEGNFPKSHMWKIKGLKQETP